MSVNLFPSHHQDIDRVMESLKAAEGQRLDEAFREGRRVAFGALYIGMALGNAVGAAFGWWLCRIVTGQP